MKMNTRKSVDMKDLPFQALDTIKELSNANGYLSFEWGRGCFWHCTFCPRLFKCGTWKGLTPTKIVKYWKYSCFEH